MEWLVGIVLVLILLRLLADRRAKGIVRRHAKTLSLKTAIAEDLVYSEMIRGRLTPGEWASRHGLDPITLQPRVAEAEFRKATRQVWERVRLDPNNPLPNDPERLARIGGLQTQLATELCEPAPMLAELERQSEILVELYALGARVDAEYVNDMIEQHPERAERGTTSFNRIRTQQEYDEWQRQQVKPKTGKETI